MLGELKAALGLWALEELGRPGSAWVELAVCAAVLFVSTCVKKPEYFMHDRHFPLWDQAVSVGFRANAACFFLAAPLCPLLLL